MPFHRQISGLRDYILHSVLVLISLVLISSNHNKQIESFKMWMLGLFCKVQEQWDAVHSYIGLKQKYESLLLENTSLALENSAIYEMRLENERLRALIGFKDKSEQQLIPARVIFKGKKGLINGIVLNVGEKDSVKKGMPLVVANGLVGKVYDVGENQCTGHILVDQNFRVSAKIQRSRVETIVKWDGGDFCWLKEVPNRSDVKPGDWVITSGYGGNFPPGIIIGQVSEINESTRSLFMEIKMKPAVDFEKLEEVFVVATKNNP